MFFMKIGEGFKSSIEKYIKKIKHDPSYSLDSHISVWQLLGIVLMRVKMLTRGEWRKLLFIKSKGKLFIGKGVVIKSPSQLSLGRTVTISDFARIDALSKEGIIIENNVTIPEYVYIRCTGVLGDLGKGLVIGNNTGLGHYNFINAQGGVVIGNDVIIGPYVQILSENHKFLDENIPIRKQGVTRQGIVIADNVWIGAGAIILDGVTIGEGAVVAAGAVVSKSVSRRCVVGGVPARVLKDMRSTNIK